jgi:23S rRNA (cytosine1962-C5)-methyltransferase
MDPGCLDTLKEQLDVALAARSELIDVDHRAAFRLFAGFYEGCPDLVVDVYARTLVLYGYGSSSEESRQLLERAQAHLLACLPWIECAVQKVRSSPGPAGRRGQLSQGSSPARQVQEHGVWYALDLLMNQDASLYLDTRRLRAWLLEHAAGWSALNLFAYTGALGVAALAGSAARVVQVDRSRKFMDLALRSCRLNQLDEVKMSLYRADFFSAVAHFKRTGELFDAVIVDPPYFSATGKGTVNLVDQSTRVINKARPLVKDGGYLVAINNALFLKGVDYLAGLERLCGDGYLSIETILTVPADFTGYPSTRVAHPPVDPAPFNHPTKIVVLKVRRKT